MLNYLAKSLEHVSKKKIVLGFMRHAARNPIPPGSLGNAVEITAEGIYDTLQVRELLKDRILKVCASPVLRCMQTATLLSPMARYPGVISNKWLGDPGIFVEDPEAATAVFLQYQQRPVELAEALLNRVQFPGFSKSVPAAIHALVYGFFSKFGEEQGVSCCITHDSLLGLMVGSFFPEYPLFALWPNYLDTLFVQREKGGLFVVYRGMRQEIGQINQGMPLWGGEDRREEGLSL